MPSTKKMKNNKEEKRDKALSSEGKLAVDVYETKLHFIVLAAIAGVTNEEIDISVDKDMLIIKGYRSNPEKNDDKKCFYQECHWGTFSRKIILPENVDTSGIEASITKGILKISFPKIINN